MPTLIRPTAQPPGITTLVEEPSVITLVESVDEIGFEYPGLVRDDTNEVTGPIRITGLGRLRTSQFDAQVPGGE